MKNYIQESRMITLAAPAGGLTSGAGVIIGNLFGIGSRTALVGERVAISTEGVYELPKLASAVIAAGARVSWDDAAKQINVPAVGRFPVGTAIEAAGNDVARVRGRGFPCALNSPAARNGGCAGSRVAGCAAGSGG
jgi:predicted RecA/RadA family phage recombinase